MISKRKRVLVMVDVKEYAEDKEIVAYRIERFARYVGNDEGSVRY